MRGREEREVREGGREWRREVWEVRRGRGRKGCIGRKGSRGKMGLVNHLWEPDKR